MQKWFTNASNDQLNGAKSVLLRFPLLFQMDLEFFGGFLHFNVDFGQNSVDLALKVEFRSDFYQICIFQLLGLGFLLSAKNNSHPTLQFSF